MFIGASISGKDDKIYGLQKDKHPCVSRDENFFRLRADKGLLCVWKKCCQEEFFQA